MHVTLNGDPIEIEVPPTMTLLELLRDELGLCGTKEGCAEGDCGACTVVLLDPEAAGGPRARAVDSCIMLAPMVDGRQLWTVEGLARDGAPHPAQQAVVERLASQCGYCTPGVVMSLVEACHRSDTGDAPLARLDDQMCGNLCRCTGYRPIREAAFELAGCRPADAIAEALADPAPVAAAAALAHGEQRWFAPEGWDALWAAIAEHPEHRLVCGGTDLGLDVTQRGARPGCLISLERLPELRALKAPADGPLVIGAATPLSDVEAWAERELPVLARMLRFFGSRQIKHRATLGGNLCTASPIGDTAPVLLALGATLVLRSAQGERPVPIDEFFLAYRQTALAPGEILARVEIPRPQRDTLLGAYKVSRRREMDISAVSGGFALRLEEGVVGEARLAFGGMAATPARAARLEAALIGQPWSEEALEAALPALEADFTPLDDHRASAWYRRTVAANLVRGFLDETRAEAPPVLPERPLSTLVHGDGGSR